MFTFRATKGGRVVLELFGFKDPASPEVRVLAYVSNVRAAEGRPPQERLHAFPNSDHATRFVDETILCFEYLGCIITANPPSSVGTKDGRDACGLRPQSESVAGMLWRPDFSNDWPQIAKRRTLSTPVMYWGRVVTSRGLRMSWKNKKSTARKPTIRPTSSIRLMARL